MHSFPKANTCALRVTFAMRIYTSGMRFSRGIPSDNELRHYSKSVASPRLISIFPHLVYVDYHYQRETRTQGSLMVLKFLSLVIIPR